MALPTTGPISLNQIHVEAGGTTGTEASMNDSDIRGLLNAAANSQMTFSGFYGASATIGEIARGNSSYSAGDAYTPAVHKLENVLHTPTLQFGQPYVTNTPTFTMNNRNTQFMRLGWGPAGLFLDLFDLSSSATSESQSNTAGVPANSGFTTMKLKNSSGTVVKNKTRSSATYSANASTGYNTTQYRFYSRWVWTDSTNPFPNSNNTTLFTVELE